MTKQSKNQYLGHVGEVEVLRELLDIGASINSLSASDFGWDLHVHLPKKAMVIGEVTEQKIGLEKVSRADLNTWEMSGYTANIQVKNQTSNTAPSVTVSTLRGWLTGSRVGVPTFVIIVRRGHLYYLSPYSLGTILDEAEGRSLSDAKKVQLKGGAKVSVVQLSRLLYIWTRFPQVMLVGGFDDVLTYPLSKREERMYEHALELTGALSLAWLRDHDQSGIDDQRILIRESGNFAAITMERLNLDIENEGEGASSFCFEVRQHIVANRSERYGYADNEYVKIYSQSGEQGTSKQDAERIINEICIFMREL